MFPIKNELIRLQILLELYEYFFQICDYRQIERQEYRICPEDKCAIIAALYYLNDRGFITVRTTDNQDVFIIFIRARGIDEVEPRLKKAATIALSYSYGAILIPNFDDVPNCCDKKDDDKKNKN
ncbi:hypothetical protein [Clostridium sp.]|uniref:hypothetical protein n=1 Tax=Clostridium sp. TaxID=1506 RepID=UPI002FC97D79